MSQFFTVFGSLMFIVSDLSEQDSSGGEDSNGKVLVSYMVMFLNVSAAGMYPAFRFINAWAESGEIDRAFIKNNVIRCLSCFMGTALAKNLLSTCDCLAKAQGAVDDVKQKALDLKVQAEQMRENVEGKDLVKIAKDRKKQAEDLRQNVDNAQTMYNETQTSLDDTKLAAKSFRSELNSRQEEEANEIQEERRQVEIPQEDGQDNAGIELAGPMVVERSMVETRSALQDKTFAEPVIHSEICFVVSERAVTDTSVVDVRTSPPRVVFVGYDSPRHVGNGLEAYSPPPPPRRSGAR